VKSKVKSTLIIFFDIKRIVHKEFVLAGQQSIPHTIVTIYGNSVKMCEDFAPNFGDKRTGYCFMKNVSFHISFFANEFLTKNNMTVEPSPPYFSVSLIGDKTNAAILRQLR
jgi:hypothetical protein